MLRCSADTFEHYMSLYGWEFTQEAESQWRSGWKGIHRYFNLDIFMTDTWIMFMVKPFYQLDFEQAADYETIRYLLELNQKAQMVKLYLDEDGSVVLSLQVYRGGFSYEELATSLGIMGHYADELYGELLLKVQEAEGSLHPRALLLT